MTSVPDMAKRILFICNDHIGTKMAGPGIRAWELGRELSRKGYAVAILSRRIETGFSGTDIAFLGRTSFLNLVAQIWRADHVVQVGRPLSILLSILFRKKTLFDQYDPVIFEFLEKKTTTFPEKLRRRLMLILWRIRQRLISRFGDGFLVANEKQKDFLIGQMTMLGHTDKLERVSVLPFGLPDAKPVKTRPVLRGTKIKETDFLLVWGGGIWGWFDPFTLLAALAKIRAQRDDIKAHFPGIRPPNPDSQKMAIVGKFLEEARRLSLLETTVFVNADWTPYERRADYLLEADAGISLHNDSMETRFAFRTRMLDYVWAGLPIIASKGDSWADIIEQKGLGITVPCKDPVALSQAIIRMADEEGLRTSCREHTASVAGEFRWDRLAERLMLR
jgi:glycosyltransferase involved in cell wall biosynthesis